MSLCSGGGFLPAAGAPETRKDNDITDTIESSAVAPDELRQLIERVEQLEGEKRDIGDQIKEVYAEAKGRGYATGIMREIVKLRRMKREDVAERDAILELYRSALGMA